MSRRHRPVVASPDPPALRHAGHIPPGRGGSPGPGTAAAGVEQGGTITVPLNRTEVPARRTPPNPPRAAPAPAGCGTGRPREPAAGRDPSTKNRRCRGRPRCGHNATGERAAGSGSASAARAASHPRESRRARGGRPRGGVAELTDLPWRPLRGTAAAGTAAALPGRRRGRPLYRGGATGQASLAAGRTPRPKESPRRRGAGSPPWSPAAVSRHPHFGRAWGSAGGSRPATGGDTGPGSAP